MFNQGDIVADVAVLRGRAVSLYGPDEAVENAYLFEQAMITEHVPFTIIFDQHLDDLSKYRTVALPDVRMLEDSQIDKLVKYVEQGGGLVITDQTATRDRWGRLRTDPLGRFFRKPVAAGQEAYEERGKGRIVLTHIERPEEFSNGSLPLDRRKLAETVVRAAGSLTFRSDAPIFVGMEFIQQPGRFLVNLVDFSMGGAKDKPFVVRISSSVGKIKGIRFLAPGKSDETVTMKHQPPGTEATIPGVDWYGVIVIDLE